MGWQFLSVDDRRQLTDELAELGLIQLGPTSRSALLNQAGLANLISQLDSLGNSSAQVFAAELVSTLENETTLPEQPHHQALGLLLDYVLSQSDTSQSTREVCARLIVRYRLIDDEAVLGRLAAEYGAPDGVSPWRDVRRLLGKQSEKEKLNWLAAAAIVAALALLVVFVVVDTPPTATATASPSPTAGLVITEYRVALTVEEGCPEEWAETLKARIKENVDAASPTRQIVYGTPDDTYLVLAIVCNDEAAVWTARWTNPAPIFEIVGSPQEVEIAMPLNLADSELLGRALIHYGQNNYNSARNALTQLANRVDAPYLQLLYANTLLLTEEFADTVEAYTQLIDDPENEGDLLALAYNNRGLSYLDEYHRQEGNYDPKNEEQSALGDLTEAQGQLTAASAPEVSALVHSNAGIAPLLLMFVDDDKAAITRRAEESCRAAEAADPGSTWMRACHAALVIEPLKTENPRPCKPDEYDSAKRRLDEALDQNEDLALLYYWQTTLLYLNVESCNLTPETEDEFQAQCKEWRAKYDALLAGGWAPLFLHQYQAELFPNCIVFDPEFGRVPHGGTSY